MAMAVGAPGGGPPSSPNSSDGILAGMTSVGRCISIVNRYIDQL